MLGEDGADEHGLSKLARKINACVLSFEEGFDAWCVRRLRSE